MEKERKKGKRKEERRNEKRKEGSRKEKRKERERKKETRKKREELRRKEERKKKGILCAPIYGCAGDVMFFFPAGSFNSRRVHSIHFRTNDI